MRSYKLLNHFDLAKADQEQDPNQNPQGVNEGVISSNPGWVIAIIRLANQLSFSRKKNSTIASDPSKGDSVNTIGDPLILRNISTMSVTNSKENHLKQLSAQLLPDDINYHATIMPGDWCFGWMVNDDSLITGTNGLIERIKKLQPCNKFKDGLKFVGRVESLRESIQIDHNTGIKYVGYSLGCLGFTELDAQIFYDVRLSTASYQNQNAFTWLPQMGINGLNEMFGNPPYKDNVDIVIPSLIDKVIGPGNPQLKIDGVNTTITAPLGYTIPVAVGKLLGKTEGSKQGGAMSYADILEVVYGVQDYSEDNAYDYQTQQFSVNWSGLGLTANPSDSGDGIGTGLNYTGSSNGEHSFLIPKITERRSPTRKYTGNPCLGSFPALFTGFVNKPLWSELQNYLNPVVNEMFTVLRPNEEGNILPQVILRQKPLTSQAYSAAVIANGEESYPVTEFLSLPRWVIDDELVLEADIGRSNATRINFVSVLVQTAELAKGGQPIAAQLPQNPPIHDDLDIQRSGFRSFMVQAPSWISDSQMKTPSVWTNLVADFLMGSHLTMNGTMTIKGCDLPICEGDNIEWHGIVFHIESVSHTASISGDGYKTFSTRLSFTHGMRSEYLNPVDDTVTMYPGTLQGDFDSMDPSVIITGETAKTNYPDATYKTTEELSQEGEAGSVGPSNQSVFDGKNEMTITEIQYKNEKAVE